ncbi:MAG: nitroreductase family protein [Prevotellaceae bacterium]|jgi:nitroreductase|nr:nitroreductase family protein [Prevotellaceae bacterium]
MKKIIILTLVSAFVFIACNQSGQQKQPEVNKRDIVLSNIHSRKSVRNFVEGKTIPKEDLETLLKAGMAAPSAVNLQPWHFVVIDNRADLDSLSTKLPYAKMLTKASAAIIVCGDSAIKAGDMAFWEFDCSLVSANILLAAEAMGLGAVWTAVHPDPSRIEFVKQHLQLPDNIIPLNVIPIGYPTGEDKSKDKFKAERIHYNKW